MHVVVIQPSNWDSTGDTSSGPAAQAVIAEPSSQSFSTAQVNLEPNSTAARTSTSDTSLAANSIALIATESSPSSPMHIADRDHIGGEDMPRTDQLPNSITPAASSEDHDDLLSTNETDQVRSINSFQFCVCN